jgi:hypothetical protein
VVKLRAEYVKKLISCIQEDKECIYIGSVGKENLLMIFKAYTLLLNSLVQIRSWGHGRRKKQYFPCGKEGKHYIFGGIGISQNITNEFYFILLKQNEPIKFNYKIFHMFKLASGMRR